jgi:hydrogenase maturation protein HypF
MTHHPSTPDIHLTLDVEGIVQGVGFRPTIKRLADEAALTGSVQNRSGTVRLVLEGQASQVERFITDLPSRLPPRARVDAVRERSRRALSPTKTTDGFSILDSATDARTRVSIPADLAVCADCRREVFDPASRFFGYAFTTCTDCGPRYTVVDGMPYDRARTTLRAFPLCADCQAAYEDPADRRFHAESIACPRCGPRLALHDRRGRARAGDPLRAARAALAEGKIVAVRGLGGFLLALDARDTGAIARLRDLKHRPAKPLAVMARDLETAARAVSLPDPARALLTSEVAPIVILDLLPGAEGALPVSALGPDARTLGVMLPTTPLHALLFEPLSGDPTPAFDWLVMTSGNRGGEPICISNDEAFERLAGIADAFLVHDRDINLRNDDSLVALQGDGEAARSQVWRRARGYAPEALRLPRPVARPVLAMGAELKNAIALAFEDEVVLSPHVGDLETPEALDGLERVTRRFPAYFERRPARVAVDLHPDMHATRLGRAVAAELDVPVHAVQHHHAHAAAVMAEHGIERALALVFDGTGLGPDGTIWGGELLLVTRAGFERLGCFAPAPLPGGDAAVQRPVRQLVARWLAAGAPITPALEARYGVSTEEAEIWAMQVRRGLNCPMTSAAGRLFDAFSVASGAFEGAVSYEGQAAIRLEALARGAAASPDHPALPWRAREEAPGLVVDFAPTFAWLAERAGLETPLLARAFHVAVAEAALQMAEYGRQRSGLSEVVLSGGVWMNRLLTSLAGARLRDAGFEVHLAQRVPPNDGGIALGQAWIAGGVV